MRTSRGALVVGGLVVAALVVGAVSLAVVDDDDTNGDSEPTAGVDVVDPEGGASGPVDVDGVSTAIGWGACPLEDQDLGAGPEVQDSMREMLEPYRCAVVAAPLDHADPSAGTLDLFVQLRPAPAEDPIGPLFVNQGGPGANASGYSMGFSGFEQLDRFDIVGMDPRGVARSTVVSCGGAEPPVLDDVSVDDATEARAAYGEFAQSCAEDPLVEFVNTNNTARDMDLVRELLGADQLTYHGKSYGSDLGTAYATLFPERLRAAVLDGVTDLTLDPVAFIAQQANAAVESLERYFDACRRALADDPEACAWTQGQQPEPAWESLAARLTTDPVTDPDSGDELDDIGLRTWVHNSFDLTFEQRSAVLDELVLENTIPEGVIDEAIAAVNPQLARSFFAVTCSDLPVGAYDEAVATLTELVENPPSDAVETVAACSSWPTRQPIAVGVAEGAGPILVVGTTGDVPTPYASAVALAEVLASAELLTWDADSHTAYIFSPCVLEWEWQLLLDLELPPPGTVCTDPSPSELAEAQGEAGLDGLEALDLEDLELEGFDPDEGELSWIEVVRARRILTELAD